MTNEALRKTLNERQMTPATLAELIHVDPKTVGRWLSNSSRAPHPRTRWAVADALEVDESMLWPDVARSVVKIGADREIQTVYPSHADAPDDVWRHLIADAKREITLCGYAPHWLWRYVPQLNNLLADRAAAGCRVRFIIGDDTHPLVPVDEAASGAPLTLTARIAETIHLLRPLQESASVEVRVTALGWGRSVYMGDHQALADWWLHAAPGATYPLLHLRRRVDGGMFDALATHLQALWVDAEPLTFREDQGNGHVR